MLYIYGKPAKVLLQVVRLPQQAPHLWAGAGTQPHAGDLGATGGPEKPAPVFPHSQSRLGSVLFSWVRRQRRPSHVG